MKNTIENKELRRKYLINCYNNNTSSITHKDGDGIVFGILNILNKPENYYAESKPLSEITDEDAREINKLTCGRTPLNRFLLIDALNYNHDGIVSIVADYLRYKGFAISYNGLSVEELINRGWLKLKK